MRNVSLVFVLLLLVGCAPAIPDWIDGNSTLYPDDQYLVGIGYAPTRNNAEDRARAAIAKIFAVQVQSRQSSSEAFWMARVGDTENKEYRQELQSDLVTRTDRLVTGSVLLRSGKGQIMNSMRWASLTGCRPHGR